MALSEFDKLIQHILREAKAPGPEHERLRGELSSWAVSRGFTKSYKTLPNGSEPDVLCTTPEDEYLLVGDAKDSANETADHSETLQRIWTYVQEFAGLLGTPRYKGGHIAIATNSKSAASGWVVALNTLARIATITGANGSAPDFQIVETAPKTTWIIFW